MSPTSIQSRRLLVVGASSGIGREIGLQAARHGAAVAFAARRAELLEEAAEQAGERGIAVPCDVRDAEAVAAAIATVVDRLGGLDTVVYATGASPLAPLPDADAELWRGALETNVLGAALVLRAALPHLRAAEQPRIAVLSSHSVDDPWPGLVPYVVSKAALDKFVEGWRTEITDVPMIRMGRDDSR